MRGTVLVEDKRSERFVRTLVRKLGYTVRNFRFHTAPSGVGAAEAWVRRQYPKEVHLLRMKNFQKSLCLLAVRDGDNVGILGRKRELDEELQSEGMIPRQADERIATPVSTWSIETWLLTLSGTEAVTEDASKKKEYETEYQSREKTAIANAAGHWLEMSDFVDSIPSIVDGRVELHRIDAD